MTSRHPSHDERTSVENASYRWGYLVLAFGLLVSVAYRSFFLKQSSWDVLGLLLLSGGVTTRYQGWHHSLPWRWAITAMVAAVIAAALALVSVIGW